jgi:hypothetical protein
MNLKNTSSSLFSFQSILQHAPSSLKLLPHTHSVNYSLQENHQEILAKSIHNLPNYCWPLNSPKIFVENVFTLCGPRFPLELNIELLFVGHGKN